MNTFTKESLKDKPDTMWGGGDLDNILKQYERVLNLSNNLLIPHIDNYLHADMIGPQHWGFLNISTKKTFLNVFIKTVIFK